MWHMPHHLQIWQNGDEAMLEKILVVCVGNICRSPTAENLLRDALVHSEAQVSSAGIAALVDSPIEPTARLVLEEQGHVPGAHRAVQITAQSISESDLILVMEKSHRNVVLEIAPEARGKIFLLGKWQDDREISDPFRQGKPAFVHAYTLIKEAVHAWALRLQR